MLVTGKLPSKAEARPHLRNSEDRSLLDAIKKGGRGKGKIFELSHQSGSQRRAVVEWMYCNMCFVGGDGRGHESERARRAEAMVVILVCEVVSLQE